MKFYMANKKKDIDLWVLIFKKVPWSEKNLKNNIWIMISCICKQDMQRHVRKCVKHTERELKVRTSVSQPPTPCEGCRSRRVTRQILMLCLWTWFVRLMCIENRNKCSCSTFLFAILNGGGGNHFNNEKIINILKTNHLNLFLSSLGKLLAKSANFLGYD